MIFAIYSSSIDGNVLENLSMTIALERFKDVHYNGLKTWKKDDGGRRIVTIPTDGTIAMGVGDCSIDGTITIRITYRCLM
jgi:hypothetical protein